MYYYGNTADNPADAGCGGPLLPESKRGFDHLVALSMIDDVFGCIALRCVASLVIPGRLGV